MVSLYLQSHSHLRTISKIEPQWPSRFQPVLWRLASPPQALPGFPLLSFNLRFILLPSSQILKAMPLPSERFFCRGAMVPDSEPAPFNEK